MGASSSPLAGALEILPVREIRERCRPARGVGAGIPADEVVDALVGLVRWELGSPEGPELAGLEDALERADPELAELIRQFSRLGEGEQWEVLREFAGRQAEALAGKREEFLRYLDERFPDLATHAAVLVARLDGRADDETFEWTLGELMANVDVIPVLAPPEHMWAVDMVLKLVGALGDLAA